MEKVWSVSPATRVASAFPFVSKNFNGEPIEVKSESHLQSLCKQFGVTHRPDAAWVDKELQYERGHVKMRRDSRGELQPVYSEGSGRGLPGGWV